MRNVKKVVGSIPGRVKPKTLKLVSDASPLSTQRLGVSAKADRSRVRIMCLGEVARLPVDRCFQQSL